MSLFSKDDIRQLVAGVEGTEIIDETDQGIDIYDNEEERFLTYHYLEDLDVESLFIFNSLGFDKEKFFKVVRDCFDLDMFMIIKKIVFVNSDAEGTALLSDYPSQSMDFSKTVGTYFYKDCVIVVNAMLIKRLVEGEFYDDGITIPEDEFTQGLWETLIHELRHSIVSNPIVPVEHISVKEGDEDRIEEYCRNVFNTKIRLHPDYMCFLMGARQGEDDHQGGDWHVLQPDSVRN